MREPQTTIGERFSWGLGIGIQHSSQGDALWQNGMTFGYRSVMVIYPDQGMGVYHFLVACDTVARTVIAPSQIPVGVLTALAGGPFFLWLLATRRR